MQLSAYTASSVLELLRSVTSSNSSSATGFGWESADPFAGIFGGTAMSGKSPPAFGFEMFPQISSATINALLATQSRSLPGSTSPSAGTGKPAVAQDPFSQLDANGDGQVSRSEFEATAASAATTSYDLMDQLIARQMQSFASSSTAWMSL